MNPLIQGKSGTTPVMSRNAFRTNQVTNEDDPQSDPRPEAGIFGNQMMRKSGQKDRRDMVTGVTEQTRNGQKDRRDTNKGLFWEMFIFNEPFSPSYPRKGFISFCTNLIVNFFSSSLIVHYCGH